MTTQQSNDSAQPTESQPTQSAGDIPFPEYEKMRRSGKSIAEMTAPSEPGANPSEQKKPAKSESAKKESQELNQEDSEDESSSSEDESGEDSEKDKPKKKGGFQRRIDKLNARIAAREQELEYWRTQAMKTGQSDAPKEKVEAKQAPAEGKPNPDKFDTHVEYVEALAEWKIDQREKQRSESDQKQKAQEERQKLFQAHAQRVKAFAEKTEDFNDSLEALDDVPSSPELQELIVSSEYGPALLYELAKNKEEAVRIARLSPLAAARELGKIESRLAAKDSGQQATTETKKLTKAPKPLEPVEAGSAKVAKKSISDPDLSFAEYEALRREQQKRRRG